MILTLILAFFVLLTIVLAIIYSRSNSDVFDELFGGAIICVLILIIILGIAGYNHVRAYRLADTYNEYVALAELIESNPNTTQQERTSVINSIGYYNRSLSILQGENSRLWQNWLIPDVVDTLSRIPYPKASSN